MRFWFYDWKIISKLFLQIYEAVFLNFQHQICKFNVFKIPVCELFYKPWFRIKSFSKKLKRFSYQLANCAWISIIKNQNGSCFRFNAVPKVQISDGFLGILIKKTKEAVESFEIKTYLHSLIILTLWTVQSSLILTSIQQQRTQRYVIVLFELPTDSPLM